MNSIKRLRPSFIGGCSIVAVVISANAISASAQQATPAEQADSSNGGSGEIVVTARKRAEDILKTPVSVSAFTSEEIQAKGIQSVSDMSNFTPSLKIVGSASGRNDRSFQQVIVRGFTPSSAAAQTTSMFIDGVPVSTATGIQTITDPERIEVLKGPQSAYFGRQTFAGAVNVVTKAPPSSFEGTASGMLGTRDNHDVQLGVGGPIFDGLLGFRATVQETAKQGSWKNQGVRGQTLGDQRTRAATLALHFTPASNLTAKAFGMYSQNDDGPNATGFLAAYAVRHPTTGAIVVPDSSNCAFGANRYFCGTLPGLPSTSPSMNTVDDAFIKNFLANPKGRLIDPKDGVQGYGLKSRFYHLHLAVDWEATDALTLSSLTGYNNERRSQLSDLDLYYDTSIPNQSTGLGIGAGAPSYFNYPYLVEAVSRDFSQELRASYDDNGPFTATVGASYLNAFFQGGGGGNNGGLGVSQFSVVSGATRNKTYGIFFGLGYKITSGLSINFDGRYQVDHIIAYARPDGQTLTSSAFAPAGFYPGGSVLVEEKYRNFMPRVIVNYDINPETMVYASYSKGINPAAFNTVFLSNLSAPAQALAAAAGLKIAARPEKLDNYEIGLKGRAFGNVVRYSFAAYYGIWKDQLNAITTTLTDPATGAFYSIQATDNTGRVRMTGIEGDITAAVSSRLTLGLNGSINDSSIRSLSAPTVTRLTGVSDFRGKENPLTSKYAASASAQYTVPIKASDLEAFGRIDFAYKSGVYTNAANTTKTPDLTQVNLRAGIGNGTVSIEAFVNNVFNNKAYPSAIDFSLFTNTGNRLANNAGVAVALRELRTAGVRVKYNF